MSFKKNECQQKAGKGYRGYSANIEETVGKSGSVVTAMVLDNLEEQIPKERIMIVMKAIHYQGRN